MGYLFRYELVWGGQTDKLLEQTLDKVAANKREQALVALGTAEWKNIEDKVPSMTDYLDNLKPCDGSDWTDEEKEKFHLEIFRLRKDMTAVSEAVGKDLKTCMTYYLSTYKQSNDYRRLKAICASERLEKALMGAHGFDECAVCGDGGSLIICDGCEGEYHMGCLNPKLKEVPEGYWECDECVDERLLKAREYIITNSNLYEPHDKNSRVASPVSDDASNPRKSPVNIPLGGDNMIMRPSPPVLEEIKLFAQKISEVFAAPPKKEVATEASVVSEPEKPASDSIVPSNVVEDV